MPRTDPAYVGAEGELLWAFLGYGRDTPVPKTDGLADLIRESIDGSTGD